MGPFSDAFLPCAVGAVVSGGDRGAFGSHGFPWHPGVDFSSLTAAGVH